MLLLHLPIAPLSTLGSPVHYRFVPCTALICLCPVLPAEMRPKGRGRPQRILLGSWPDDTVKNVIRAVVFRDTSGLKEQQMEEANAAAAAAAAGGAITRNNVSRARLPSRPAPMSASICNIPFSYGEGQSLSAVR